ncbi:hypothetical protein [Actinosynnema sp. NPDC020468]|uniref:hypothetical protein n=1 Tax=Actinosynnema sp. NPDC020468 TaxID=3154488 RepID=UPI0033FD86AC
MSRVEELRSPSPVVVRVAFVVAVVGALLVGGGVLVGVVDVPPSFSFSWVVVLLAALLPVGVAFSFLRRGDVGAVGGALVVAAVFSVGTLVADLQVLVDAGLASRPELFRATTLVTPAVGAGLWVLLAGHLLTIVAGVLAVPALRDDEPADRRGFGVVATAGVVAGIGLFMAPFSSTVSLLPAHSVPDEPAAALVGGLLLVLAAPLVAVLAASSAAPTGALRAAAAVLVGIALVRITTALATDGLSLSAGPFVVLVGGLAFAWPRREARAERADPVLPGRRRLHVAAAVLGLVAAAFAVVGALTDQLVLPAGLPAPTDYASRSLWPAAVLTGVLALALLARAGARPAFVVATATVPLAAAQALDAVFNATRVNAVQPGAGAVFTALAVVAAAAAATTAAVAGAVERDEAEAPPGGPVPLPLLALSLIGGLLAIGAFALPVLRAPDVTPITAFGFRLGSWGQLLALAAVLVAAGVALRARPARGAALLLGGAAVLVTRALEYPLTQARAAESVPGPGLWLALGAVVALLVAAAVRTTR